MKRQLSRKLSESFARARPAGASLPACERLDVAPQVVGDGGVVGLFVVGEHRPDGAAEAPACPGRQDRPERHVQHLAGVEVVQQVGQGVVGQVGGGGTLLSAGFLSAGRRSPRR